MRQLLALAAFLALVPAAQAQDHAAQQMCFTWLSLSHMHALPESKRADFASLSSRMDQAIDARTDVDTTPGNPDVQAAIDAYNGWLAQLARSSGADEVAMREALAEKAEACASMVPAE